METDANKRILCFGDSNTWGYDPTTCGRYAADVRWTGRLAALTGWQVLEEGLNNRTSAFPDPITPWANGIDAIESCVMSQSPFDALVVMLGTNDMKTYICDSAHASATGVMLVVERARNVLHDPALPVLVVAPPHIGPWAKDIPSTMLQLDEKSISSSAHIADYLGPMAREAGCGFLDAGKVTDAGKVDGVHLSPEGHDALARAVASALRSMLGQGDGTEE